MRSVLSTVEMGGRLGRVGLGCCTYGLCVKCWTYGVGLGVVGSVYISSDSKAIHFLSYITISFSLVQH